MEQDMCRKIIWKKDHIAAVPTISLIRIHVLWFIYLNAIKLHYVNILKDDIFQLLMYMCSLICIESYVSS